MIVADTPALAAIFLNEPAGRAVEHVISLTPRAFLPVSCIAEIALLERFGPDRFAWLEALQAHMAMEIVSIEASDAHHLIEAARR